MATITQDASATPTQAPENLEAILVSLLEAEGDVAFLARDDARAMTVATALRAGDPDLCVIHYPGSDALPADAAPATPGNVGQRTHALRCLRSATTRQTPRPRIALISTGEAAARLTPAPQVFEAEPPIIAAGDRLDLESFNGVAESLGYFSDDRVDEPGEYAVRGQVVDIFPSDAGTPVRIEVSDGTVASIRAYDALTQLSADALPQIELGRAAEPEAGDGVPLLAHLPGAHVALDRGADHRRATLLRLAADAGRAASAAGMCDDEAWQAALARHDSMVFVELSGQTAPRFAEQRHPARSAATHIRRAQEDGLRVVLLGTPRDLRFIRRRLTKLLGAEPEMVARWSDVAEAPRAAVVALAMPMASGFRTADVVAVTAGDLLGSRAERSDDRQRTDLADVFVAAAIRIGDVVIHEDHGLARIAGIEPLPDGGDAIALEFAAETHRLVPAAEAGRIWRYGGDADAVTLDKLDGSSWAKRRGTLEAALAETARALTALAAEREARTAPALDPEPSAYERFAAGFPFAETADQARAIAAVRGDLASGKLMDRLVVGDVGFGKTEVALRAAACAALAGWQVALAAPTTVLARQHLETFQRRFADTGVTIAALSRFSTAAEKRAVKAGLADGTIDIVIGTGGIGGKGMTYHKLGLVILDEEQRFGAADKARLRDLGAGHMLTLTATPIPRTLQGALVGLQQVSVIAHPPARRQSIRTTIAELSDSLVRSALLRERARGGQSFLVVPRIEDIAPMQDMLARLTPELRVAVVHGKLPAADLDEAMVGFAEGHGDVLLATNIVEAGLDVPRANTMLVHRADRFGLAQLHQLRGRVGRGARRGQVLLLTETDAKIAPRTLARLGTLAAFDRLGAGFAIAASDLDMRGAGDLFGEEQAGHVKLIGVELYQHLLELALRQARGEPIPIWSPTLNIGAQGVLPDAWIGDEDTRLGLYFRLARLADLADLESFEEELADRFGDLAAPVTDLLALARVRLLARQAGVARIDAGPAAIAITPHQDSGVDWSACGLARKGDRFVTASGHDDVGVRLGAVEDLLLQGLEQ
ncbi:MAG: helicase-related protein [Novosphingobium sp.]|nr:helicase-related protein [Novosphingobium sp.]